MSENEHGEVAEWLLQNWATRFCESVEGMTGERPQITWRGTERPPSGNEEILWWEQPLSLGHHATFWVGAGQPAWLEIGTHILRGAGIEAAEPTDAKNTYMEILSQASSGLAGVIGKRVGTEVTTAKGKEMPPPAVGTVSFELALELAPAQLTLHFALLPSLLEVFEVGVTKAATPELPPTSPRAIDAPAPKAGPPRTLDLLLEIELPVSVSFGRAQLPLKDVLKLTSGSIVELNRAVADPVEVIVNNCVIARGEVVVVEGNYGIRIQEIISREKRLRTLQ